MLSNISIVHVNCSSYFDSCGVLTNIQGRLSVGISYRCTRTEGQGRAHSQSHVMGTYLCNFRPGTRFAGSSPPTKSTISLLILPFQALLTRHDSPSLYILLNPSTPRILYRFILNSLPLPLTRPPPSIIISPFPKSHVRTSRS